MPMMTLSDDIAANGLLHGAFILIVLAFLVRDVLWLRLLMILANTLMITAALSAGADELELENYWYVLLVAINGVNAAVLIYERRLMRLTAEERRLYETVFSGFDRTTVLKLLRIGAWRSLPAGEVLAREGEKPDRLILMADGAADVCLGDRRIAELGPGRFVCEISFITQRPANATVTAQGPLRCLIWDRPLLEKRLARDARLETVMHAAIGSNLATKISAQNAGAAASAAITTEWDNGALVQAAS